MPVIKKNLDLNVITLPWTGSGAIDVPSGIPIDIYCNVCAPVTNNPGINCLASDSWNCNLCGNDTKYDQPYVIGDCINFQFQFQDTLNSANAISYAQYQALPNPKIPYGWYHSTYNPTNYTIRAYMIDACTDVAVETNDFEAMIQQACVYLFQDSKASYIGYPSQAWYRWGQNISICPSSATPNSFYLKFVVSNHANVTTEYFSDTYTLAGCGTSTMVIEGVYDTVDCRGFTYHDPSVIPTTRSTTPPYSLASNCLYPNRSGNYRNAFRVQGISEYVGVNIEKNIPKRFCASVITTSYPIYRVRTKPVPPYMADRMKIAMEGKYSLIDTIQVNNMAGIQRQNDVGRMWIMDFEVQGCQCVQDQNC